MEKSNVLRVPLKMENLFQIPQDILDGYDLYAMPDMSQADKNTIMYLDDHVSVDDETDEEIYPKFSVEHNLIWFFSGPVVADIIMNTKHQLQNPTVDDFIVNFNYYNKNDCFFTFQ